MKVKEEAETLHHNVEECERTGEQRETAVRESEGTGQNRQQEVEHWADP